MIVRRSFVNPLTIACCLLLFAGGCATYRFGHGSLYRQDVRTVYLPMIENNTFRRHMGEQLTEAIAKEIELHTPYKVVHTSTADSVLQGRILAENKTVLSEDINDNPRDTEFNVTIEFRWTDSLGNSLMQPFTRELPDFNLSINQASSFVTEAGQSVATAKLYALQDIARQVRREMEATW